MIIWVLMSLNITPYFYIRMYSHMLVKKFLSNFNLICKWVKTSLTKLLSHSKYPVIILLHCWTELTCRWNYPRDISDKVWKQTLTLKVDLSCQPPIPLTNDAMTKYLLSWKSGLFVLKSIQAFTTYSSFSTQHCCCNRSWELAEWVAFH